MGQRVIERYVVAGVDTGMIYRAEYDVSLFTTRALAEQAKKRLDGTVTHEKLKIVHLKETRS